MRRWNRTLLLTSACLAAAAAAAAPPLQANTATEDVAFLCQDKTCDGNAACEPLANATCFISAVVGSCTTEWCVRPKDDE